MPTEEIDACDQFNALVDRGEVYYVGYGIGFSDYAIADKAMAERMAREWPGGGVRVFSQADVDQHRAELLAAKAVAEIGAP